MFQDRLNSGGKKNITKHNIQTFSSSEGQCSEKAAAEVEDRDVLAVADHTM